MQGRIAVGGVEQVPVAGGDLVEERQHGVAEQADGGHGLDLLQVEEAVALGVVGFAGQNGRHEVGHHARVHLPVAVDLDHDVHAIVQRGHVTGNDCRPHTSIDLVADDLHPRVDAVGFNQIARAFRAAVVHHIHRCYLGADAGQHVQNVSRDLVGRDDDGNLRLVGAHARTLQY